MVEKPPILSKEQIREAKDKGWTYYISAANRQDFTETVKMELRDCEIKVIIQDQRDFDTDYFEPVIQQARTEVAKEIFKKINQKARFVEATDKKVLLGATQQPNALILAIEDWQSLRDGFLKPKKKVIRTLDEGTRSLDGN